LDAELTIEIADQQATVTIDEALIRNVVSEILAGEGVTGGQISVAVVDDPTIHGVNRQHLNHDYPTDVISFVFDRDGSRLDGEVIVSADAARGAAEHLGWAAENELLLYVVHGTLHLVGYDDRSEADREQMRGRESHYLARFGMVPPWQDLDE
jgi:probable rRNA maturation factor